MTDKNIQIKIHNGVDWDSLFPKTKATITLLDNGTTVESAITDILSTLSSKATLSEVETQIEAIIGSAPSSLDTLKELAEALNNDSNFASTVTTEIGKKVDKITGKQLSTNDFTNDMKNKLDNLQHVRVSTTEPSSGIWFEEL